MEWWGKAPWPPFPLIIASKEPPPANMGPDLEATSPIGMWGVTCNPKIAVTFSKAPASKIFLAPAPPSSAGWKTRTTVPYLDNKIMNYQRSVRGWKHQNKTIQNIVTDIGGDDKVATFFFLLFFFYHFVFFCLFFFVLQTYNSKIQGWIYIILEVYAGWNIDCNIKILAWWYIVEVITKQQCHMLETEAMFDSDMIGTISQNI